MVLGAHFEIQGLSQGFSDLGYRVPRSPGKSRGFAPQQAGPQLMLTPRRVGEAALSSAHCGRVVVGLLSHTTSCSPWNLPVPGAGWPAPPAAAFGSALRGCSVPSRTPALHRGGSRLSDTPPPLKEDLGPRGRAGEGRNSSRPGLNPSFPFSRRQAGPFRPLRPVFACSPVTHLRARWMRGLGVCVKLARCPHRWWSVHVAEELS